MKKMQDVMENLRSNPLKNIAEIEITSIVDYMCLLLIMCKNNQMMILIKFL